MPLSEETSRKVFVISFFLFAVPSIVLISAAAVTGSAIWAFFAVAEIGHAFSPGAEGGSYGLTSALSVTYLPVLAALGLVALWKFTLISSRYASFGRQALVDGERLLWSALAWSVLPTIAATVIAFLAFDGGGTLFDLGRLYLSGLPLFVPLGHLFLELKRRGDVTEHSETSPASGALAPNALSAQSETCQSADA